LRLQVGMRTFWVLRRIVRNWRLADARTNKQSRRIVSARCMLKCADPNLSAVRGVREWIGQPSMLKVLDFLNLEGHRIDSD